MEGINETLKQRGEQYGPYEAQAAISQTLKRAVRACPNWAKLRSSQRESIELTLMKFSRILNGNPDHLDSWIDVVGYVTLVIRDLEKNAAKSVDVE
jgi:hypothetical protein